MRERERVALHAINDRFSFTEKEKRGEAKAKGNVTWGIYLFICQGLWYISCWRHPSKNNLVYFSMVFPFFLYENRKHLLLHRVII